MPPTSAAALPGAETCRDVVDPNALYMLLCPYLPAAVMRPAYSLTRNARACQATSASDPLAGVDIEKQELGN